MSDRQVTIVCGPPCAGKTTYVQEHKQDGDLVVDYDEIARSLGSPRTHGHHIKYHRQVERTIARYLNEIMSGVHQRAWVIRSLPSEAARESLARQVDATEVVVLDDADAVLQERAWQRPNRYQTLTAIQEWRQRAAADAPTNA